MIGKVEIGKICCLNGDIRIPFIQKCLLNNFLRFIWILSKLLNLIGCQGDRKGTRFVIIFKIFFSIIVSGEADPLYTY